MILPDLGTLVRETLPEDLPALAGWLREAESLIEMRIRSLPANGDGHEPTAEQVQPMLTYQEAAEFLRCSVSYVETLVRQGKLPHFRLPAADKAGRSRDGRLVRFRASDLGAWADEHRA